MRELVMPLGDVSKSSSDRRSRTTRSSSRDPRGLRSPLKSVPGRSRRESISTLKASRQTIQSSPARRRLMLSMVSPEATVILTGGRWASMGATTTGSASSVDPTFPPPQDTISAIAAKPNTTPKNRWVVGRLRPVGFTIPAITRLPVSAPTPRLHRVAQPLAPPHR